MINQTTRIIDILISILILIISFPILLIISLLILIIDGRPVFFKQVRIGYKGKPFNILKFRTMKNFISKNEKFRLTTLGKALRKTSLDELPQFINVIRKDMSIVGPRPLPTHIEKKIKKSMKLKRRTILPGITGMSQINYTGKNRKLIDKLRLDLELIKNYNFYNYFKILVKTPNVLILRFLKNKSSIIK